MASPTSKARKQTRERAHDLQGAPRNANPEAISPIWLLKAFGLTVLAALVCGYLSVCLLFYQGQWQLVLHPLRPKPAPFIIGGAAVQTIRFGVDESATPQLSGWWIPSEPNAKYPGFTVLYLPSGDGSLQDHQAQLAAIHGLGLNLFAFDYRGYGQSADTRPNQQRMTQDATSAWQYLTVTRALPANRIILFGNGVGCFLAAQLAAAHPEAPAVVFDSPRPDLLNVVLADPRVSSIPVRALFHERFDITRAASSVKSPKLFLLNNIPDEPGAAGPSARQLQSVVDQAPAPKMTAHLAPADRSGGVYSRQISRFLDEYLR